MHDEPITLLVVEDNDLDVENIHRIFSKLGIKHPIVRAKDGVEGLSLLKSGAGNQGTKGRRAVLLDLNMPRMNGFEFLGEVRKDPAISHTPVFVMTTSDRPKDIHAAYQFNIAGYLVKSFSRDQMIAAVSALNAFWNICEFPNAQ